MNSPPAATRSIARMIVACGASLRQVAARARLAAARQQVALGVGREEQHGGVRRAVADLGRGLEAVHDAHADVHDHDVGAAALGERDRGLAVGGLADDPDVRGAGEREAQPLADDLVVVGDQAGDGGSLFFCRGGLESLGSGGTWRCATVDSLSYRQDPPPGSLVREVAPHVRRCTPCRWARVRRSGSQARDLAVRAPPRRAPVVALRAPRRPPAAARADRPAVHVAGRIATVLDARPRATRRARR